MFHDLKVTGSIILLYKQITDLDGWKLNNKKKLLNAVFDERGLWFCWCVKLMKGKLKMIKRV